MSNGWFPRLNSRGDVVSGAGAIEFNGTTIATNGTKPQFRTDDLVVYVNTQDDCLYEVPVTGGVAHKLSDSKVSLFSAGNDTVIYPFAGDIGISVDSKTGAVARLIEFNGNNADHSVVVDGKTIVAHGIVSDVRAADGLLAYSVWTGRPHDRGTWAWAGKDTVTNLRVYESGWEGAPVPFMTPEGPWILFQTNEDLRLHPWFSRMGYIIHTGEDQNFNPDVKFVNNTIAIVWNTGIGTLGKELITLGRPREDISSGVVVVIPPPPPPPPDDKDPKMPDNFKGAVEALRVNFPTPLGDQHWKFLVTVCQHIGPNAKLFQKDGGTNVFVPPLNKFVSTDIIILDGWWVDILGDAENEAKPTWDAHPNAGEPNKWLDVSNIRLEDHVDPPKPGEDPRIAPLVAQVALLAQKVTELQGLFLNLDDEMKDNTTVVDLWAAEVKKLQDAPKPKYKIKGNTFTKYGHNHGVDLLVEEVK